MIGRILFSTLFLLVTSILHGQERLTMSIEQLAEYKCMIVENYFQFKKSVSVVSDKSYEPLQRNANEIALVRLLHRKFTTTDLGGGNREQFVKNLKTQSNSSLLLKKTYTVFDCPSFDFINSITNDEDVRIEMQAMDIIDLNIKTTKYKGWMLFAEEEYRSYGIKKTWATEKGTGITKRAVVKKLHYEIYRLDDISVSLKIRRVEEVDKVETNVQKDTSKNAIIKFKKKNPQDFIPCCSQPKPSNSDSDEYNDLVDCDIYNSNIYPGAPEIIANGIDEDCDGKDQLGEDKDQDGYYYAACLSPDPETRKLCDCNENDVDVHYRDPSIPENEWYFPDNGWNDDNCDCVKDKIVEIPWANLSFWDYVIVGKGHLKKGPKNNFARKATGYLYATSFISSTSYAVYSKIKSNKYYNQHLESETFRTSSSNLEEANKHNKRFLIFSGVSALIFSGQAAHLYIKNHRQKKYRQQSINTLESKPLDSKFCSPPNLKLTQDENGIGIGLIFKLN